MLNRLSSHRKIAPISIFHFSYLEPRPGSATESSETTNGVEETTVTNGDVNMMEENSNPVPDNESSHLPGNR